MQEETCPSLLDTLEFLKLPEFKIIPEPQKKTINFLYDDSDSEEAKTDSYNIPDEEALSDISNTESQIGSGYNMLEDFEKEMYEDDEKAGEYKQDDEKDDEGEGYQDNEENEDDEDVEDNRRGDVYNYENEESDSQSEEVNDYDSEVIEFDRINNFVENIKNFLEEEKGENIFVDLVEKRPLTYNLISNGDKEKIILTKDLSKKKIKKIVEIIDYIKEQNMRQ